MRMYGPVGSIEEAARQRWQPIPLYERLIELRQSNRQAFDGLDQQTRHALNIYEAQKRHYESINSGGPQAA